MLGVNRADEWGLVLSYVEQVLVPTLAPGDIVILDNFRPTRAPPPARRSRRPEPGSCSCRDTARPQSKRERRSKLKAQLRWGASRTVDELGSVIGQSLDAFMPPECANYFAAAGYDAW